MSLLCSLKPKFFQCKKGAGNEYQKKPNRGNIRVKANFATGVGEDVPHYILKILMGRE